MGSAVYRPHVLSMAWPNPFRTCDQNTRTRWGYTFQITEGHLTPDQMEPMKHSYDVLGEKALDRLNAISPPPHSALPRNSSRLVDEKKERAEDSDRSRPELKRDMYELLRDNAKNDAVLSQLWEEVNAIPAWVDWEQIARGQDCFYRYGGPALTGLAFQSLLGGMVDFFSHW